MARWEEREGEKQEEEEQEKEAAEGEVGCSQGREGGEGGGADREQHCRRYVSLYVKLEGELTRFQVSTYYIESVCTYETEAIEGMSTQLPSVFCDMTSESVCM